MFFPDAILKGLTAPLIPVSSVPPVFFAREARHGAGCVTIVAAFAVGPPTGRAPAKFNSDVKDSAVEQVAAREPAAGVPLSARDRRHAAYQAQQPEAVGYPKSLFASG